jgi:hypothetical protein
MVVSCESPQASFVACRDVDSMNRVEPKEFRQFVGIDVIGFGAVEEKSVMTRVADYDFAQPG